MHTRQYFTKGKTCASARLTGNGHPHCRQSLRAVIERVFVSSGDVRERAERACEQLVAQAEKAAKRCDVATDFGVTCVDDEFVAVSSVVACGVATSVPKMSDAFAGEFENACRSFIVVPQSIG